MMGLLTKRPSAAGTASSSATTGRSGEGQKPLCKLVKGALDDYFRELNGHSPGGLYRMVLEEVERPLLETVMQHTGGNVSRAAEILGLNRGTLRKKLAMFDLLD